MKISEVIKSLQKIMEEYGDCECRHLGGDNVCDFKGIKYFSIHGYPNNSKGVTMTGWRTKKHSKKVQETAYNCYYVIDKNSLDDEEFEYVLEEIKARRISKQNRIREQELAELARLKAKYES